MAKLSASTLRQGFDRRTFVIGAVQGGFGLLLAARMGYIAVAENEKFTMEAESNRVNLTLIPPRRGWILDRRGVPLASNRADFRIDIVAKRMVDSEATIGQLTELLKFTPDQTQDLRDRLARAAGFQPVVFAALQDATQAVEKMAEVCMENYDTEFSTTAKAGDILVTGYNFGCGSSREQAATAILAKQIPLVVAGSFGNIFSRNSINNALMGLEVPRLISRLRETFSEGEGKALTRRTGWTLTWDVRRSQIEIQEGPNGAKWTHKVGELPPNVQEIIAKGGLEKWVKNAIEA